MKTFERVRERIKPYRSYDHGDKVTKLIVDRCIPLKPSEPVSHVVRYMLNKNGLDCPSLYISAITEAIDIIQVTVPLSFAFPPDVVEVYNEVSTMTEKLADLVPTLAETVRVRSSADTALKAALHALAGSAANARNVLRKHDHKHQTAFWHEDAEYLRRCLLWATTRAGTAPSFTKANAPAVRFLHDVLMLANLSHPLTGKSIRPTYEAIADALRRKQRAQ